MSKEAVEALLDKLLGQAFKYAHMMGGTREEAKMDAEIEQTRSEIIRAALQQQEGQGWQSIETAPKDRSWMLGACSGSRVVLMAWNDTLNFWEDLGGFEVAPPTHWMPLPTPPEPGA